MTRRTPAVSLLLSLLPVVLLAGQQQRAIQNGDVSGHVSDAASAEPVPNATVELVPLRYSQGVSHARPQTSTSLDGAFHFATVAPGVYVITVAHAGFVPNKLNSNSQMITVSADESVTGISIPLTREGIIRGTVTDENGTPLPGSHVQALAPLTTYGQTSVKMFASATADAQGRFLLSGLPANNYYVLAKATEPKPTKDGDLVQTFYPRSLDVDGAGTVPVSPGETVGDIAVRVRRTPTFHIRGKVADVASGDSSSLTVSVTPSGAANSLALSSKTSVKPSGGFDIPGLVPGAYTLRLTSEAGAGRSVHLLLARQQVEVSGADMNGVVLSAMPPLSVTGQVSVDSSSNITLPAVSLTARPLEDAAHGAMGFVQVARDGSFAFANLDPGLYLFQAHPGASGWYVKTLTLNQQDILNKEADLSDTTSARLEVVLSPNAAQVNVTVQGDGSNAGLTDAGETIVLAPESVGPDGSGVMFSYARQHQASSFKNVRPGKYFCYAVRRGDPNLWQNPQFLAAAQSLGTPVEVAESSTEQLQIPVLPLEQVEQVAARVGFRLE